LPGVKVVLFGVVVASLLGILGVALVREATTRPTPDRISRPSLAPTRPPLTAAEEAYSLALWPIHNEVKASALKTTFAAMSYKLRELDRAALKSKVDAALDTYRKASARIRALQPPPSLQAYHVDYLEAIRLYERSATEIVRVVDDGRDDHLVAAFPLSHQAGVKLLQVGNALWPGEYKPN
jgi:hypothetical protein